MGLTRAAAEAGSRSPKAAAPRALATLALPVCPPPEAAWEPKAVELSGSQHQPSFSLTLTHAHGAGLSPELVSAYGGLGFVWPNVLAFLRALPKPTTLVAHNGAAFDFPLLRAEMRRGRLEVPHIYHSSLDWTNGFENLPEGMFMLDSIHLFRHMDKMEVYSAQETNFANQAPLHRPNWSSARQLRRGS